MITNRLLAAAVASLCLVAGSAGVPEAEAKEKPSKTLHVDCAATPGGDGSKSLPYHTITAALPAARARSAAVAVTIEVAEGVCDDETFPIQLNFPVRIKGSRSPGFDSEGRPVDGQQHDTLITWTPPSPVPPTVAAMVFLRITAGDVRLSKLSLDGRIVPGTVAPGPAAPAPTGVLVDRAAGFEVDELRIVRMGAGLRAQAASGEVRDTYVGTVGAGFLFTGGAPATPPEVRAINNRVQDYWTGAFAVVGAGPAGQSIRTALEGNDTSTRYADTGPSNPFGLRLGPILGGSSFLSGTVDATVEDNSFRGAPRYAIILNGGQLVRRSDGRHYTGVMRAAFAGNSIERDQITRAPSLITFTNSRATELPCELDPANTPLECPTLMGNPIQYWEYLESARYEVNHTGELDGALIDHPELDPVDGRALHNQLVVNGTLVDNETFVVVP